MYGPASDDPACIDQTQANDVSRTIHCSNSTSEIVDHGTNHSSTFSTFLPGISFDDVMPGDISSESISTEATEAPLIPDPYRATAALDHSFLDARRVTDQEKGILVEGKDLLCSSSTMSSSSLSSSEKVSHCLVRGKSLEGMKVQALHKTRMSLSKKEEEETDDVAFGIGDEEQDADTREVEPDEDDIADGSSLRQLKPYRDLSSASSSYIKHRRKRLLEERARRLGSNCDYVISEEDPPRRVEEKSPLRLSERQKTQTRAAVMLENKLCVPSTANSPEDNAPIPSFERTKPSRTSRKTTEKIVKGDRKYVDLFPVKLHRMLSEIDPDVAGWRPHGRAFRVNNPMEFVENVIPKYGFKQSKMTSFNRQLNLYGFSRIVDGPDDGSYYHECFLRGLPSLLGGMVRVKVKRGEKRPKPADIAKTQPNFYAMSPIVKEAKEHTCTSTAIPENFPDDDRSRSKRRRQANEKASSKRKRSGNKEISENSEPMPPLPPPSRPMSPISFTDEDIATLPYNIDIGSVFEHDADDVNEQSIERSAETSSSRSRSLPPVSLNIQRCYPAVAGGIDAVEITTSPIPIHSINTISHQVIPHGHVLPPSIYRQPSSATLNLSSPGLPLYMQSNVILYEQSNLNLPEPMRNGDIYGSLAKVATDVTATNACMPSVKNRDTLHVQGDMCGKCIERMEILAQLKGREEEVQHSEEIDARLFFGDWYNIKGNSAVESPSGDVEREAARIENYMFGPKCTNNGQC